MTGLSAPSGGRQLRVAFDMTFPDRNQGGSGMYARSLVAALRERDDLAITEIRSKRPGLARTLGWLSSRASRELRSSGAQLLHCPSFVTPWNVQIPFVVTVFDLSTRQFPADHPLEWRVYERRLLPARVRAASRVIAISDLTRQDVVRHYGVDPRRVVTIHPGVERRFFVASEQRTQRREPVILFPGAPVKRKNLDLVLAAMAQAESSSPLSSACLRITGPTADMFPEYAARIRSLGLEDRVEWLGLVAVADMPGVMAAADLCVYPSWYEGFGFPPLEAMAVGTPVVASNVSCLPEILGDAALLVDPSNLRAFSDAVESVLADGAVRERLIQAGRRHAMDFTWDRCAEDTMKVYEAVLAEAG